MFLEVYIAGKGVFVSEEISETEGFLAQLLMEVIEGRGDITDGYKQYFSDWAMQQLKNVDWSCLDIPGNWGTGQPVDEEHLIYYQSLGDTNDEVEITEEEYININKRYQAIPEELEWQVLEGFY